MVHGPSAELTLDFRCASVRLQPNDRLKSRPRDRFVLRVVLNLYMFGSPLKYMINYINNARINI